LDLPDGDGLHVLNYVKSARQECVVVVLTSYVDLEIRECCFALGADHFFEKSIEFEQAIETIDCFAHGISVPQNALQKV
jgi:DNA-binding NarL/FixJ family response regulator